MGDVSCPSVLWAIGGLLRIWLCWILLAVPCETQPPVSLSLPAQMSLPPPWQYLPLSQAELGSLFSNSSPFSFSQSLLVVPPAGPASTPGLRASFGPYSVTQMVSEPIVPLLPWLSASLLSGYVERETEAGKTERFCVRAVFHLRGRPARASCITLHAFRETQEHKASCITQPPLGLCVVTLTLPKDWLNHGQPDQSFQGPSQLTRRAHRHRGRKVRGRRHDNAPGAPRYNRAQAAEGIQLYYSTFDLGASLKQTPPSCEEDTQSQGKLFYIGAANLREAEQEKKKRKTKDNKTKQEVECLNGQEEEELRLDSNVIIRYGKGPFSTGQPIGVSINLRADFSAEFVVIRLKVNKGLVSLFTQRTLTSEQWVVTLERTQILKHDIISIICHKRIGLMDNSSTVNFQQVACLAVDGLQRSFGVAMTVSATWWVEYSGRNNPSPPLGGAESIFCFTDRPIVGIASITESNTIINTAILSNEPVSLPVTVLSVEHDGKVSDITTAVRCKSSNEDIIKVSIDCSTLFVDGSESGIGSTCVGVDFFLGTLSSSLCLAVWAPSVPLRLSLSDPVLNAIEGWNHFTETGCSPVYQRATVQVLTQFTAQGRQGQLTYLLGSSDWFVDVTELVRSWLRVEDPAVASLHKQSSLIGLQPGKTSVHIISSQWDGVLGSCDVTVSSDFVTPGDLSVQVVSGLGMSIKASPAHPSAVTATVTAYNILYNHGQEASISVWLQFGDDTASLLSSFRGVPFLLRLSSLAESVVSVTQGPTQHIVAQGDGGGPLLKAELLVSSCSDEPIMSNSILDRDRRQPGGGGGIKRLAKGSGWIRVNLDSEHVEEFELDISDVLVESNGDFYNSLVNGDDIARNTSDAVDYYEKTGDSVDAWNGGNGIATRNNLGRAVLTPNYEESVVYLSPGLEREGGTFGGKDGEREEGGQGFRELKVGLGAILSLLSLSALLIFVNCLPCALKERKRKMGGVKGEEEEVVAQRTEQLFEEKVGKSDNVLEKEIC